MAASVKPTRRQRASSPANAIPDAAWAKSAVMPTLRQRGQAPISTKPCRAWRAPRMRATTTVVASGSLPTKRSSGRGSTRSAVAHMRRMVPKAVPLWDRREAVGPPWRRGEELFKVVRSPVLLFALLGSLQRECGVNQGEMRQPLGNVAQERP